MRLFLLPSATSVALFGRPQGQPLWLPLLGRSNRGSSGRPQGPPLHVCFSSGDRPCKSRDAKSAAPTNAAVAAHARSPPTGRSCNPSADLDNGRNLDNFASSVSDASDAFSTPAAGMLLLVLLLNRGCEGATEALVFKRATETAALQGIYSKHARNSKVFPNQGSRRFDSAPEFQRFINTMWRILRSSQIPK